MNVGDNTTAMNLPSCSSGTGWRWCQYGNTTTPYVTTWNDASFSAATVGPSNSSWNSTQGVGQVYTYALGGSQATTTAFIRGGSWNSGSSYAGAFALNLSWGTNNTAYTLGFRCAR
jgi:formylglycine-generating enzyme required for sulfatase activity